MLAVYQSFCVRHLRLRWPRASLVVLSIAVGVATWVATGVLNHSMEKSIQLAATPLPGVADFFVSNGEIGVHADLAKRLKEVPGVKTVQPLTVEPVQIQIANGEFKQVMLIGLDLALGSENPGDASTWGVEVSDAAKNRFGLLFFQGGRPVLVGQELSKDLPKDTDALTVQAGGGRHRVSRAGAIDASGPLATMGGNVLVTEGSLASMLLGRPGRATRLDVLLEPNQDREVMRTRLRDAVAAESGRFPAELQEPTDQDDKVRDALLGLKLGFALCGAGALVIGMFLVYNALAVSVAERTHDIGILRSLGATRGQVRRLFLGEALLLGLIGTLIGLPLGLGLGRLALGPVQKVLTDIFLPMAAREVEISPANLITASVAGLATALIAALIPSTQAAFQEPADAVRRVPPTLSWLFRAVQVAGSLLVLLSGASFIALKSILPARWGAYGGITLLFIGCMLITPVLAALVAGMIRPVARRLLGIEARLAADNLVRAPGRTGLVIAALAASIALFVETAGVIRSNEDAILAWLDRSVTTDLIVTSGGSLGTTGQNIPMGDDVAQHIHEEFPEVKVLAVTFRNVDWDYQGGKTRVLLAGLDARVYYEANIERHAPVPHLDLFRRLADEKGAAIVSDNFAQLHGIKAGDKITLPSLHGPVEFRVLGSVEDYSWNRGTIYVDRANCTEDLDFKLADVYDLYLPPGSDAADIEKVRERVQKSDWGTNHLLFAVTRHEAVDYIITLVRQLYGLAYSQLGMVALVAALGVLMALMISVIQRRRELGLLRAVGACQWQVLRTVLSEAVLMGVIGTVIGILMGIPLQWYVVQVILFDEAGFAFPVVLPWKEAGVFALLALAIAMLAGLFPAMHAGRMPIAEAIAYE
jgi:putative ABC transport system permease protein